MQLVQQGQFDLTARGELEEKFWEFHSAHPEVYKTLVHFARQWRGRRGSDAICGIGALYERARWEMWFESLDGTEPPKLSNNHRAFYARLIMERNPDLEGIFNLKRQRVKATFGPEQKSANPYLNDKRLSVGDKTTLRIGNNDN
jgi:hypothetical protein